jgi:hypothetical protein
MDAYCIAATLFRFLFFSVEKKNDMKCRAVRGYSADLFTIWG